jgi:hypothetical protein
MNSKKWKQYLNEECGCGMGPPPMPMVKGHHEDIPLEDEDEHEHEGAHEHMPEDDMPTLQMVPKGEDDGPMDESPYPENIDELVAMIADLINDFLKSEKGEEHDCDVAHPEESHEHWKMKNLLGKGSSPCG